MMNILPTLLLIGVIMIIVTFLSYFLSIKKPKKHWGSIIGLLLILIFLSFILINAFWSALQWQIQYSKRVVELCKNLRGNQIFPEIGQVYCDCYNGWSLCD